MMEDSFTSSNGRRLYYALRRRSDGVYLNCTNYLSKPIEQKRPAPLRRLTTARTHRLRVLRDDPAHGFIDIEKVIVVTIPDDGIVEEDDAVTEKLMSLCKTDEGGRVAEIIEPLLRDNNRAREMRYVILYSELSPEVTKTIKSMADVICRGDGIILASTDTDLIAIKLAGGTDYVLIFDLVTKTTVFHRERHRGWKK